MELIVVSEHTAVTVVERLEDYLEHGSLSVRIDHVTELLTKLRQAANAATLPDAAIREGDPIRHAEVAQLVVQLAESARALAIRADEDDPHAAVVLDALSTLRIAPAETNPVRMVSIECHFAGDEVVAAMTFPADGRVLTGTVIPNHDGVNVSVRKRAATETPDPGDAGKEIASSAGASEGVAQVLKMRPPASCVVHANDELVIAGTGSFALELSYQLDR